MSYIALNKAPHLRYLTEFEHGLRVKRKEKHLYIRKCNNNTNNYKKQNSLKKRLVQSYKYLRVLLPN